MPLVELVPTMIGLIMQRGIPGSIVQILQTKLNDVLSKYKGSQKLKDISFVLNGEVIQTLIIWIWQWCPSLDIV